MLTLKTIPIVFRVCHANWSLTKLLWSGNKHPICWNVPELYIYMIVQSLLYIERLRLVWVAAGKITTRQSTDSPLQFVLSDYCCLMWISFPQNPRFLGRQSFKTRCGWFEESVASAGHPNFPGLPAGTAPGTSGCWMIFQQERSMFLCRNGANPHQLYTSTKN